MIKEEEQTPDKKNSSEKRPGYILRLYVTGASPNSVKAITNIKEICDAHLKDDYTLEVIDVHQQPALASKEQIIALPLLIKKQPLPERRLIGDLSNTEQVLKSLGLSSI